MCRIALEEDKVDVIETKHVLLQHQRRVITATNEECFQRIHVRRSNLFHDAFRAFSRSTFDISKMLKVCFIGDASIDDGGPRREFFSLLLREIFDKSGLFYGWPDHVVPLHHIDAIMTNQFYMIGKMMVACMVQGGEPPVCFSKAVADYLAYERIESHPCINDIPDVNIRNLMNKVI